VFTPDSRFRFLDLSAKVGAVASGKTHPLFFLVSYDLGIFRTLYDLKFEGITFQ